MRIRFWRRKPGNLETFARRELELAGVFDKNSDYGGMLGEAVMRLVREFTKDGHSGFSAGLTIAMFKYVDVGANPA